MAAGAPYAAGSETSSDLRLCNMAPALSQDSCSSRPLPCLEHQLDAAVQATLQALASRPLHRGSRSGFAHFAGASLHLGMASSSPLPHSY